MKGTLVVVARRFAWSLVVLWAVLTGTFALAHVLPADPARSAVGPHADPATIEKVRAEMGLDRPLPVRYARYLRRVAAADLGTSYRTKRPVTELLLERARPTVELALAALALQILGGLALGLAAAARRGRFVDSIARLAAVAGQSMPAFVIGPLLLYAFAYRFPILPNGGYGDPGLDRLKHVVLPALTIAATSAAYTSTVVRGETSAALAQAFARTARAKGASPTRVLIVHALRASAGPIVTLLGIDLGALLGGAFVTEYVFAWPGLGREAVLGILEVDLPVVLGVVLVSAVAVLVANLAADVAHALLDPRVRPR